MNEIHIERIREEQMEKFCLMLTGFMLGLLTCAFGYFIAGLG